jgi:acetyl esterase
MPLDPQFRIVLDTLEDKGLTPLVRGYAAETRVHYRRLALSRRGPQYVPDRWLRRPTSARRAACRSGCTSR